MGNYVTKWNDQNHQAPLLQPALQGDIDQIKTLIGHSIATSSCGEEDFIAFVNQSDPDGNTALHGAVFSGHLDIVKFLIRNCHADWDLKKNAMGCSPFWIACGYRQVQILEYILSSIREEDKCSLSKNSSNASFDLSRACRQTNTTGDTPLLAAVFKGYFDVVEMVLTALLAESPADTWDILTMKNKNGDTCLGLAISIASSGGGDDNGGENNNSRLIRLLLDLEERLAPEYCIDRRRPLYDKNVLGLTPLIVACERDNVKIVKLLISKGADIHTTDKDGRSPLAIASFCGCVDVLDYLLGRDDIHAYLNRQDSNGCTPIWLAARTGNVKVVRKLVDAGADATIQNNAGLSAVAVAEKFQKQQVLDFFQQKEQ